MYPWLPSWGRGWHEKRRKGLAYRHVPPGVLECQTEQDRIFWEKFLHPEGGGRFLEIGAGDGVTGSHTLGLELLQGWSGEVHVQSGKLQERAKELRTCKVLAEEKEFPEPKRVDLLAIHRPDECPSILVSLKKGQPRPSWVIVENRKPNPRWCRWLERFGYRLRFFFHDDEYFQLTSS